MKHLYRRIRLLVVPLLAFLLPQTGLGQQSLFNVPSSELTTKGKFFVQQQINVSTVIQANTTIDYGLNHDWEIGLNMLGIDYSEVNHCFVRNDLIDGDPLAPLLLVNVQKGFKLGNGHHWKLGLGTQQGLNLTPDQQSRYAQFTYANLVYTSAHERVRLNGGIYTGNTRYLGDGSKDGMMFGADIALIHHKIHLMGDWILGDHDLGVAVLGMVFYPHHRFPISLGWQMPNDPKSPHALVLELTWTP